MQVTCERYSCMDWAKVQRRRRVWWAARACNVLTYVKCSCKLRARPLQVHAKHVRKMGENARFSCISRVITREISEKTAKYTKIRVESSKIACKVRVIGGNSSKITRKQLHEITKIIEKGQLCKSPENLSPCCLFLLKV